MTPAVPRRVFLMTLAASGVALAPASMFGHELAQGLLVRPFVVEAGRGRYWLTRASARDERPAAQQFRQWLCAEMAARAQAAVCRPAAQP